MNDEARRAAVAALIELAKNPHYRDRADAGRSLASFAEMPETKGALLRLVLDDHNTFVTLATAEALLRRHDSTGLATVAAALASADLNQVDWIHTAVRDVFEVYSTDRDAAIRECDTLLRDADEQTRHGADDLIAMLADINPILHPVQNE